MVDGPSVLGISALKESSLTIKIVGKAKPMTQGECEMKLRKEIKKALDKEKILVPYPRRRIVMRLKV
jgi:small conductance mechanosensitive channel